MAYVKIIFMTRYMSLKRKSPSTSVLTWIYQIQ